MALIGPNGAGKTTLIRVALGELTADSGTRVLSRGTRLGYLPQEAAESFEGTVLDRAMEAHRSLLNMREELDALHQQLETIGPDDPELETVLERAGELQSHLELLDEHSLEPEARRILSGLGFPTQDQDRPLAEFSGGWRMRAALAALLLADPTVLFLDEPTNHLDLPAMEWLEDYLVDFHGGLVVVSHDRVFLDRVTTGIRELEHGLTDYPMKFTEYLDEKERRREQAEAHNVQVELGTTYGGNGKSNFALPDLQGRAPMHPGQGPGLSLHDLGETGGSETVTLLESEIPAHAHALRASDRPADDDRPQGNLLGAPLGSALYGNAASLVAMAPESLAPGGGDAPHNNLMPYLTFYFCIALQGVFPPRT